MILAIFEAAIPATPANFDSGWFAVLASLIGAVVGGLLTIAGDIAVRSTIERRRSRRLLVALRREVELIATEATARSKPRQADVAVQLLPPLATDVWRDIVASGFASTISDDKLRLLWDFYQKVDAANYVAAQLPTFLLISNVAADAEVRRAFADESLRIAAMPYRSLSEAAPAVVATIRQGGP